MHRISLTKAHKASLAALAVAGLTFGGASVAMGDVTDSEAPEQVVDLVEDNRGDAEDADDSEDADEAGEDTDAAEAGEESAEAGTEVAAERHAELSGGEATPADGREFGQAVSANAQDNGTENSADGRATAEEQQAGSDEDSAEESDDADETEDSGDEAGEPDEADEADEADTDEGEAAGESDEAGRS